MNDCMFGEHSLGGEEAHRHDAEYAQQLSQRARRALQQRNRTPCAADRAPGIAASGCETATTLGRNKVATCDNLCSIHSRIMESSD